MHAYVHNRPLWLSDPLGLAGGGAECEEPEPEVEYEGWWREDTITFTYSRTITRRGRPIGTETSEDISIEVARDSAGVRGLMTGATLLEHAKELHDELEEARERWREAPLFTTGPLGTICVKNPPPPLVIPILNGGPGGTAFFLVNENAVATASVPLR